MNKRLAEGSLQLSDLDSSNRKGAAENGDILRQLEEVEGEVDIAMLYMILIIGFGLNIFYLALNVYTYMHDTCKCKSKTVYFMFSFVQAIFPR